MAETLKPFRDLYALLDVSFGASTIDINRAFRKASLRYHPDKLSEEQKAVGEANFIDLCFARDTLIDEAKRLRYDAQWQLSQKDKRK